MEFRRLGRTGHQSSVMVFGAVAFWSSDQDEADRALSLAFDHGVNHIDVAPQYGSAEERVGAWLEPHRDRLFLGCKTLERRKEGARAELHRSLRRLRTDYLDLYQIHALSTPDELDEALAPGAVIETLVEARDEGKTRYLGITAHGMLAPAVCLAALERFDFDTIMFPINPRLYADPDYRRDAERLLAMAQQRDVGVMVIKAAAKSPWPTPDKAYTPWYEPYDTYETIAPGVHFALSQPVTAAVSTGDTRLMPLFLKAAENFVPMSEAEQEALIRERAGDAIIFAGPHFVTPD